ncbi:transposase [Phytohabitans rumicis]|uniref:Transposase n=2 Tax=Phytohabitans rumicis TaxID=1076125 RepID=A0A6V8L7T3_9ACTN|nr:IS3 family transposase [Phytohabitans rumicis]GFJ87580.1 transposase [Phytohabitans rumicis]GFJ87606.1 transposase [Phytohabitans rumicis]GFJ89942.1 transposase [Phytohabitans rumicis]GFJ91048.1 transposase [Phytohabitans rumicis]GFJ93529.1 transposase [Phytohabitans rumicis]
MIYRFIEVEKATYPITLLCRTLGVSRSGFHEWRTNGPSGRDLDDAYLTNAIIDIHADSRGSYGSPRVHAELRLGHKIHCGRKRVERLMRDAGLQGIHRRRLHGCTVRDPEAAPADDLVARKFTAEQPNQLWVADITQQMTWQGWLYLAVVLDVYSRRVVGWAIGDHMRAELVCDALDMATWTRRPTDGTVIHHSDHGAQYTSYIFGKRLRDAGILASMGSIGDCYDNAMAEAFFASLQTELLDRHTWRTRDDLANAIFEWINAWYNPTRRHSALGYLSPVQYEQTHHTPAQRAA